MAYSFIELDKAVVHVIRLVSFLWLWFSVCLPSDGGLWRLPDGRDWLKGKLGLVLMGGAMLSKSLIQFSVEGRECVPFLLFDLRPNYGGDIADNGDLLQKGPCTHCYTLCPQPCSRPPPTHASTRGGRDYFTNPIIFWVKRSVYMNLGICTDWLILPVAYPFSIPLFLLHFVLGSSVQFSCSVVSDSLPPHGVLHARPLCHNQLTEPAQTHVHRVGDPIQPSHPLSSPSPPAPNPSQHQGLFQWVWCSHQWTEYWSFSFSISPSNKYSGLISFRIDWFDFLAVQGTLKSLLQQHSSKASILQCSAFFMVQFSHPYMTTGKTIALTRQTFVGRGISLLFNVLSRLVIAFLPRSKHLLISWL